MNECNVRQNAESFDKDIKNQELTSFPLKSNWLINRAENPCLTINPKQ